MKSTLFVIAYLFSIVLLPFVADIKPIDCCPKATHKSLITPSFTDTTRQLKNERVEIKKDRLKKQKAIERMLKEEDAKKNNNNRP